MHPILVKSLCAFSAALRRFGWLPLAVFLAHELCAHVLDAYRRWPSIDIPLHFFGGLAIAYFADGALRVFSDRRLVRAPDPILRLLLLFAFAATVAVFWEFAEWTSDRFFGTQCQMNDLGDTLLDLLLGMVGGLAYLLPQLPAALLDFFRSAPESRP